MLPRGPAGLSKSTNRGVFPGLLKEKFRNLGVVHKTRFEGDQQTLTLSVMQLVDTMQAGGVAGNISRNFVGFVELPSFPLTFIQKKNSLWYRGGSFLSVRPCVCASVCHFEKVP